MRHLALIAPLLLPAAAPVEREVAGNGVVAGTLQGQVVRLLVTPAATAMPVFTAEAARRARLKAGPFGAQFVIGPVKLPARTAVATLTAGGAPFKRRVAWTDAPFAAGPDGAIGPGGVPEDVVRFTLRPARAGERTLVLPLAESRWGVSVAAATLGGVNATIAFDPAAPRTVASAAAAVALAAAHGGTVSGEVAPTPVAFGVQRPVRTLTLADPLVLGALSIDTLAVRVADGGAVNALREADADPDEVQVVAKGKPGRAGLRIGRDYLRRCSSLVFDKRAKQIRLTCA